jgi:hypothetical protein
MVAGEHDDVDPTGFERCQGVRRRCFDGIGDADEALGLAVGRNINCGGAIAAQRGRYRCKYGNRDGVFGQEALAADDNLSAVHDSERAFPQR